jgi:sigma-B regulation protein RsbU (phosphoserine phosphatase)
MSDRAPRLGLLLHGGNHDYQSEIILGAHQECSAQGADLYCLCGGNITVADPRNFLYALPAAGALDAAIVVKGTLGADDSDPSLTALLERLRPTPVCIIGPSQPGIPCVAVDNASAVRTLTRHLIERHERRRIAFIMGHGREAEERLAGFRTAHLDHGLTADKRLLTRGDFRYSSGQEAVARLFEEAGGCDAIVAANDLMALGALQALRARGLRVPHAVSVVGFDDAHEARFATPPLTTVRQDPRQLGIEAARLSLRALRGAPRRGDVRLDTLPLIRQSCGCFQAARRGERTPIASGRPGAPDYDAWVRATAARGPTTDPTLPSDWPARLIAALRSDLDESTQDSFLETLDQLLGAAAELGNLSAWHQPVATLRQEVIRDLPAGSQPAAIAESIFERAHIMVGDHAERAQVRRRLEIETTTRALEELATEVRTALDRRAIGRALAGHLPGLHVKSAAVVVHGEKSAADVPARMISGWDHERGLASYDRGVEFQPGELLPEAYRPRRRHTAMVQPLFFQTEVLGWCVLEMDPPRTAVSEAVPAQISASLKAAALQEQLVAEATKRERAERSRLEHEIDVAARIQTGILPEARQVSRLALATTMVPAAEVGGDYFDILPFDGGCWLGIGDVAGHGLHAGLVMLMIQSIVSAITRDQPLASPVQVWTALNGVLHDNVRERLRRDEHATLTLLRYHDDGRVVYAGAHEDILVHRARSGRCELVKTQGVWAGVTANLAAGAVTDAELRLEPGDTILLHTDGVTEAMNGQREMFGRDRLQRAFGEVADRTVDDIRDHVLREVLGFMEAQSDDVTLVVLRYN